MINAVYLPGHSARITAHGPLRTLFTTSVGPRPVPVLLLEGVPLLPGPRSRKLRAVPTNKSWA
jgi:hypothetical protein